MITRWKRQLLDNVAPIFSNRNDKKHREHEEEIRELRAKIGELVVERDFLAKAFKQI